MAAALLGNILAILNAFIFHKCITFKSQVRGKAMIIEFARFFFHLFIQYDSGIDVAAFFCGSDGN